MKTNAKKDYTKKTSKYLKFTYNYDNKGYVQYIASPYVSISYYSKN